MAGRQRFLGYQWMGLTVTKIAWRTANQFCDLMRVLKFRAIHFDQRSAIAEQNLRGGLDNEAQHKTPDTARQALRRLRPARRFFAAAHLQNVARWNSASSCPILV